MRWTRRNFLRRLGLSAVTGGGLLMISGARAQQACGRINGAGSYLLGPFEATGAGAGEVFLVTDMGFDETMIFCKVSTNTQPFRFPTATMGVVEFAAHEFYMDMQSVRIDTVDIVSGSSGPEAILEGVLRSETRLFTGDARQSFVEEQAPFTLTARPHVFGIEGSDINLSMTARFDSGKEHAAVFGEEVTFAGHVTQGSIIVVA